MERIKESKIEEIKKEILGTDYDLSVVFVSKNKIKSLNSEYRKINEPTDILSFEISENLGEIFICKEIANEKSKLFDLGSEDYNLKSKNYLLFLIIHGCLHLKGLDHGSRMESLEKKYFSKFKNLVI